MKLPVASFIIYGLVLISCDQNLDHYDNAFTAIVGAQVYDGTDSPILEDAVLLFRDGIIEEVGRREQIDLPANCQIIDAQGKFIIPGLINTHAHVGYEGSMQKKDYSSENIAQQLKLYADYGITTVVSLGEDHQEAESFRTVQLDGSSHNHARFYIAGDVVSGSTVEEVQRKIDENVKMGVDYIKIRVDDNLGSAEKMSPDIYKAIIDRTHQHQLKLAAHMYYLEDAKSLIKAGADFLAHSIRDTLVDSQIIQLLKEKQVCYCPTLTRDLSLFVYEQTPDFFTDPFFTKSADSTLLNLLMSPERQTQVREHQNNLKYKAGLQQAMTNLRILHQNNVTISMGTDSGVPTRFQGFFEHLEMRMMQDAGMGPRDIIKSATSDAAACMGIDNIGILMKGNLADFVILDKDPLEDIVNTRSINSVWVGGQMIE